MELSQTQKEILEAPEKVVFVKSSAASGKTRLLTEKIRQSIVRAKKLVAFTFTNMAAAERRVVIMLAYFGTLANFRGIM